MPYNRSDKNKIASPLTIVDKIDNTSAVKMTDTSEINEKPNRSSKTLSLFNTASVCLLNVLDILLLIIITPYSVYRYASADDHMKIILRTIMEVTLELLMWTVFAGVSILMTIFLLEDKEKSDTKEMISLPVALSRGYIIKPSNDLTVDKRFLNDVHTVVHNLTESTMLKEKAVVESASAIGTTKFNMLKSINKASDHEIVNTLINVKLALLEALKAAKIEFIKTFANKGMLLFEQIPAKYFADLMESPFFDFVMDTILALVIRQRYRAHEGTSSINDTDVFHQKAAVRVRSRSIPLTTKPCPLRFFNLAEGKHFWRGTYNGQWRGPFRPPGPPFQPPPVQQFPPPGQQFPPPGQQFPPPGQQFPSSGPPNLLPVGELGRPPFQNWNQFQQTNMVDVSKAEWVCHNPKTGDMMFITSVDGQPSQTEVWPNTSEDPNANGYNNQGNPHNGNNNQGNPHNGNNNQGNPHNGNNNQGNPHNGNSNTVNPNNEHNVQPTLQPSTDELSQPHGGEGLIDIRMGAAR
ncbi:uncharacterized protein LOC116424360 [Nomia melanderi]|uniref:uncharacterized protein LOC116424360 n=1 Tax=Nomia melanderi TaxID=2448451 RepID=UPI003FCE0F4C